MHFLYITDSHVTMFNRQESHTGFIAIFLEYVR